MLEHIFRNINDIRIFDLMTDFPEEDITEVTVEELNLGTVDINDIMNMMDYPEYKRIQVIDSVDHLVREEILGIKTFKIEGKTGCEVCKWTDKFKIPRVGDHKSHKPEEINMGDIDNYFMKDNDITRLLKSAVFQHVTLTLEKEIGIKIPIGEIADKITNETTDKKE